MPIPYRPFAPARFYRAAALLLLAGALLPGLGAQTTPSSPAQSSPAQDYVQRGDVLLEKDDWDNALREYREALRLQPSNPDAHRGVGAALGGKGDLDGALREFKESLRIKPDHAKAHNGVGWVLATRGDLNGALREYREAIRIDPNYARAHENVAWGLSQQGDLEGALREYREAFRVKPDDADAHYGAGWVLGQKGDADGLMREFREALRIKPDHAEARHGLIVALVRKGDWDGALPLMREGVQIKPKDAVGHYLLGEGLEHKGDRSAALEEYGKAAQLEPGNRAYYSRYERVQSDLELTRILPARWASPGMLLALTVAAALVPSFLLLGYFRARDLYPEPARMLWATFLLGVVIVYPVLWIDAPLHLIVSLFQGAVSHGLAEALFNAAIPEELLKFAVVILFCVRSKEFDEPMDGIVYGAVASLGFATYENIWYVTSSGVGTAFWRAITAVPGHAFMGAVMGYYVGQWRFGSVARRGSALVKAYFVPVFLHWMYDFPMLAASAAGKLKGPAQQLAYAEIAPLAVLSSGILLLEAVWTVRLVNRLHREQVQLARDVAAAAAAAGGAQDLVALVTAPDAPPSAGPGWAMTLLGSLLALVGGFFSLIVMLVFAERWAQHDFAFNVFGASLAGGIPLLVGLVLFVYGVKRIHASRRKAQAPPPLMTATASA